MPAVLSLRSSHAAPVDALRGDQASAFAQALGVTGFALLTALGAQFEVRLFLWEVPITLQTMAVYGSGLFLGWRNGLLAQALYLTLGLFLPVYSGGDGGASYLLGAASAGYLWGFPLAAAVIGKLSERWNSLSGSALATLGGSVLMFSCGVTVLHYTAGHATWLESIDKGWWRFVSIDLLKIGAVSLLYSGLRQVRF